jgi:hypothetical protein
MTKQEALDIRDHLMEIAKARSKENIAPDFSNELIRRLLENRDDGEQASAVDQVESAFGLLRVTAFRPSRNDVERVLAELSEICDGQQFSDVVYTDPETGRSVSLLNDLPELAPEVLVLRQFLDQRCRAVENEFENWRPPSPGDDDNNSGNDRNTPGGLTQ